MDSHLFRLNQMSYQHQKQFMNQQRANSSQNNTTTRQHYSNRQQQQQQHQQHQLAVGGPGAGHHLISSPHQVAHLQQQHQQQQPQPVSKHNSHNIQQQQQQQAISSQTSQASSAGSDQEEQVQLSSLSTATTSKSNSSSQAAILAGAKTSSQMQREQHHQMLRQQQHQQQQRHHQAGSGQHRQAALQSHTLASLPPGNPKSLIAHSNKQLASSDQLTSSSDQTIDDLHHLAPHHHNTFGGSSAHHRQHQHHLSSRYDGAVAAAAAAGKKNHSASTLDSQSGGGNRFLLGVLFTIAELLLFASVLLWLYWAYQHDDGLAWQSDRKQQFNTHAALMLFGFIFLSGQAMLIHRSFSCCSKIYTKILHTILFVLATSAISLGLILAYTAQENVGPNNKPIMHFYSLHAWCGLTTVGLFVLQFVFGFVSFLILLCCDQATANYRAALLPIHKTFGLIIFSLAIATCLTGLLQTARSRLSSKLNKVDYHELAEPGIVINLIGVCLICLAILMPYIIRNLDIKRSFRTQFDRHLNRLSQLEMRI